MKYLLILGLCLSVIASSCNVDDEVAKYTKRLDDAASSYKKQTDSLQILINKAILDRKNAKMNIAEANAMIREVGFRNEQVRYELLELDSINKIK